MQPKWFFTAYNTNGTYHTENGIDWATNNPSFGATMRGDPVVAFDSLGNLFYENMYGSTILGCKVIASANNGVTWGTSVTAIAGVDKNWIACDQTAGPYANYVYTTMTNSSAGNFARSTNHGVSFTSTFAPTTQALPGMMVCVGPQGNIQGGAVYVVTNSGSSFSATYTFYRSNDGGATFVQRSSVQWPNYVGTDVGGRNSVQNMRTRPYPMIAADNSYGPNRGKLYCVYASNTPSGSGNKPDIFCRTSADGGATWGNAIQVNDDANTQTNHQWHPSVWCDKETGRLYVMWMDTRDTPTSDSAMIYASYSANGGASFVANQKISNAKMKIDCSTCGGGGTPRYQGDYNGIVSNKKGSMVGWTDFRQGTFQSMTAYFPDFAMSLDHTTHTLYTHIDSATFQVSIPAVKLYSDTVLLSTTITPTPASGSITVSYPSGNAMATFPATKPVRVKLWGNVTAGTYTATFYAAGPNGTPVHKRTATITVVAGTNAQATVTLQPNRSGCVGDTIHVPIHVTGSNIMNMAFYVTYDHANLSQTGTYYSSLYPSLIVTYYPTFNPTTLGVLLTVPGSSGWNFSNTKVIDLIFTITGSGPSAMHLRTSPDASPLCGLWNNAAAPFTLVNYGDNIITPSAGPAVSVSVSANQVMPVCSGTPVAFTATPVNPGTAPIYQWLVNGINAGLNTPNFTYTPADGDQVSCQLTSNVSCASGNPAVSNILVMEVILNAPVTISITASANPVVAGTLVSFLANTVNQGGSPHYQWFVNGVNFDTDDSMFDFYPANGDQVSCVLFSNAACATGSPASSNVVTMSVQTVQPNTIVQNLTISDSRCYDATQTITVGGGEGVTTFAPGSNVRLIAGQSIVFLPATVVNEGAYLLGYITSDGSYCGIMGPSMVTVISGYAEKKSSVNDLSMTIYPNPTDADFIIELSGEKEKGTSIVDIYGTNGNKVLTRQISGKISRFSLKGEPSGLYYIRVTAGNSVMVRKIILSR
ncbi:MAG: T9SS type A sorting domain-containing protein [Bacteroidales bacterium]